MFLIRRVGAKIHFFTRNGVLGAGESNLCGHASPIESYPREMAYSQCDHALPCSSCFFPDGGFRPIGADFAESLAVKVAVDHYAPGDLMVIDPTGERRLALTQAPYSTLVAGIYSTKPGVVASPHRLDEALPNNEIPLAVVGIVPCKVLAENGPIAAGELLVTSSMPGLAMRGTDRARMLGAVVGKALEPTREGTGLIQVLVTLQ